MKHITWQPPASVEKRHGVDLVGFDALGNRYEVESETSRGASWHTVYLMPRSGSFGGGVREAIGTRGTLGLVKALAEQTAAEIASPAVYRDAPRGPERPPGPRKGTRRNPSWWSAGQAWLEKKAQAEAGAQLRAHLKAGRARSTFRYHPPEWQRRAVELLGANDEEGFKHLKLTEGLYDHAAKRNPFDGYYLAYRGPDDPEERHMFLGESEAFARKRFDDVTVGPSARYYYAPEKGFWVFLRHTSSPANILTSFPKVEVKRKHAAKRNPAHASVSTLTSGQIHALSRAAAQAGDLEMCDICARALRGSRTAKRAVVKAINAGQAHRNPRRVPTLPVKVGTWTIAWFDSAKPWRGLSLWNRTHSCHATIYRTGDAAGSVAFDWPERIPEAVKARVRSLGRALLPVVQASYETP